MNRAACNLCERYFPVIFIGDIAYTDFVERRFKQAAADRHIINHHDLDLIS